MNVTANTVADALVQQAAARGIELGQLKLQKLLFYVQGYHLAIAGEPLFSDNVEAWDNGPVVDSVWRRFRGPDSPIAPAAKAVVLGGVAMLAIGMVLADYGSYSGKSLVDLTHEKGTPWALTYQKGHNAVIAPALMKTFFQQHSDVSARANAFVRDQARSHADVCAPLSLEQGEWDKFVAWLDQPAAPSEKLVEFLRRPSVLETGAFEKILALRHG